MLNYVRKQQFYTRVANVRIAMYRGRFGSTSQYTAGLARVRPETGARQIYGALGFGPIRLALWAGI